MQKKILCFIVSLLSILCSFNSTIVFAAAEQQLAVFSYTASTGSVGTDLTEGDKTNGYAATSGILKSSARLYASVDGVKLRNLEWSKAEYDYKNSSKVSVPIMKGSNKNPWGKNPYFKIECSTLGYENIKFTAKVSGSNKGPANYALQYSIDGENFIDVINATIASNSNKDLTSNLFDNVTIKSEVSDKSKVYFRIIATNTTTIGGGDLSEDLAGGEAAINDIVISGTSKSASIPTLAAPTSTIESGEIYGNTSIELSCSTSDEAQIIYTVNGGNEITYTDAFMPFKHISGTSVEIRTWAVLNGYQTSPVAVYKYTCTKDEITSFDFSSKKNIDYVNGEIKATSGIYPTGRITASLDGIEKYTPLYSDENKAISIAPDDTYTWHKGGYWQIEVSTAGYNDVYMSMNAFSSKKGPASLTLKYSTDGVTYSDICKNKTLPVSDTDVYYSDYKLPTDATNKQKIYIRLVTEEDKRADETDTKALFNKDSKGNTYISNVIFCGGRTNSVKMPYTTKATTYFGSNGTITYKSPDNIGIKYSIYTENGNAVIENATYDNSSKISLASLSEFDPQLCNKFKVNVWSENGAQKSIVNSQTYTFKGDIVAAFEYDVNNGTSIGETDIVSTYGEAVLSMYPNGTSKAAIFFNDKTKALRTEADETNAWNFDTLRNNPNNDGYWLIKLSTKGYEKIKFSAKQLSTEKGPRDYSISYSTDGIIYKPLENSAVRVTDSLNETYSNISLPDDVNDKDNVYIKIKIDGGETVSGVELSSTEDDITTPIDENVFGKGNTDINNIEICGTKKEDKIGIEGNPNNIEKGKTYHVNFSSIKTNPTVIIAGYDSDNNMVFYDLNTSIVNIPSDSTITYIKIMMWDDTKTIVPLVPALTKSVK